MNEKGLYTTDDCEKLTNQQVSIPQKGNIESLNVAVAGSILLDRFLTK